MQAAVAVLLRLLGPMLLEVFFKFLAVIGVSFVSYKALGSVLGQLMDSVVSSYFQMPSEVIDLAGLAGIPEFMNIVYGAFNLCIGIFVSAKAFKLMGKS